MDKPNLSVPVEIIGMAKSNFNQKYNNTLEKCMNLKEKQYRKCTEKA